MGSFCLTYFAPQTYSWLLPPARRCVSKRREQKSFLSSDWKLFTKNFVEYLRNSEKARSFAYETIRTMIKPTDSELSILQVLWIHGPQTVRELNERLNKQSEKSIGYTTTLKLLQIMLEKGLAQRQDDSRTHIYEAAVAEKEVQDGLLDRIAQIAFRGSAAQLALRALGQSDASAEELAAIKALINDMENKKS